MRVSPFLFLLQLLLLTLPFYQPNSLLAATDAKPLEKWLVHQDTSRRQLNPGPWKVFLKKYLDTTSKDKIYRLKYGQVTKGDRKALETYLTQLQAEPVSSFNRLEQKVYWINLYNAKTVAIVLGAYPIATILDIKLSPTSPVKSGPWDIKTLRVEGVELSLNDIEHRILRPLWKDNRIHFALNCASLGCPNLAPRPFTAANSETLLEQGAKDFMQSERGVSFDGKVLVLSNIFDWYKGDFGTHRDKVIEFITQYSIPQVRKSLQDFKGEIKYQYDWNLNDLVSRP